MPRRVSSLISRIGEIGQSVDVLRPILDAFPVVAVKDTAHFV